MASIVQPRLIASWQISGRASFAADRPAPALTPGLAIGVGRVSHGFAGRQVLRELDLTVEPGQFVAIVGRSGSGKSTLLRLLAGLDRPQSGTVQLGERAPEPGEADVRIMFQDGRLLPWRRVIDNVTLGLPSGRHPAAHAALEAVGLADRAREWPRVLSGGQRQRVALARALAADPRLILLDEPLGALDALTRLDMQALIERLWQRHRFTAVLVTHDVAEAALLADRIVLLEDGRIALDIDVALPRPRRGLAGLAAIEERVLGRILQG